MITYQPATEHLIPLSWTYIHEDRELSAANLYQNIEDVKTISDTIVILTDTVELSSKLYNTKNNKGTPWNTYFTNYSFCIDDKANLEQETSALPHSQFLITIPYTTENFNILELKGITYDNIICKNDSYNKKYISFSFGSNQKQYDGDLFLNYYQSKSSTIFRSDRINEFIQQNELEELPLSSSQLIENGAIGGSNPDNSDNIYWETKGYQCEPYLLENFNGQLLFSWLSASPNICDQVQYEWVDRWSVGTVSQSAEGYEQLDLTNSHIDVPSQIKITANNTYFYKRFGPNYNLEYAQSLFDTSIVELSTDSDAVPIDSKDNIRVLNNNVTLTDDGFYFDGTAHLEIQKVGILNDFSSYTLGLTLKRDNWSCGKTHQIVGNYYQGGKGLFYNAGGYSSIISLPTSQGILYGINYQVYRIFEKDLVASTGANSVSIDEIQTDSDMARWILDNTNNKIYKLEIDDTLSELIELPDNSDIISMAIDNENHLYVLDTFNRTISSFNSRGEFLTVTEDIDRLYTYLHFDLDNNLIVANATKVLVDLNNDKIAAKGSAIYKNDQKFYPVGNIVSDILIDKNNNTWIADDTSVIRIIDSDGYLIKKLEITGKNKSEPQKVFIGINIFNEQRKCEEEQIWILNVCNKSILAYDLDFNLLDEYDLIKVLGRNNCFDSSQFSVKGDFSGYDINRKTQIHNGKYISTTNPHITAKVRLDGLCGEEINVVLNHPIKNLDASKWHYIALTHDSSKKEFNLIIDGEIVDSQVLEVPYKNLNNETTSYFVGTSSGKIGTENEERGLADENFIGYIKNLNFWNYALTSWDILSLYNLQGNEFGDLYWNKTIRPKNALEKVKYYHMFNKTPIKSQKFNLRIRNSNFSDELKDYAETLIIDWIKNIKPAHTELYSIVWE